MKKKFFILAFFVLSGLVVFEGCKKDDDGDGWSPNIFTLQDDVDLGQQLKAEIESNPQEYPLIKESENPAAYSHIHRIRDSILNTGLVEHDDIFEYDVFIVDNDTVLNAFATPGGYLYFYTGLIKFLDNEAEFAGVLGHEMAHSANRHSTDQLTKYYGLSMLVSIVLGQNPNNLAVMAADIASGLAALAFSRSHENNSDEFSVKYLYQTSYDARGVGGFFEKLDNTNPVPQFLSTHPSPDNRIENIEEVWLSLGGKEGNEYVESYNQFKSTLP